MSWAYYNEFDPFAAQWLRELIKGGHIAPGYVDQRSIEDVKPDDLTEFTQCHFFAGIGVWSYALRRAGWRDDSPVWTGSCPCQPFSAAGKGNGFADERHLWPAWFHLITQCNPARIFGEQVASNDGLAWLDLVQTDLEAAGYATGAFDLCAAGVGAPHARQRLYLVADACGNGYFTPSFERETSASKIGSRMFEPQGYAAFTDWIQCRDGKRRPCEPGFTPWVDKSPEVMGRLRGYGNAIVSEVAVEFILAYLTTAADRRPG